VNQLDLLRDSRAAELERLRQDLETQSRNTIAPPAWVRDRVAYLQRQIDRLEKECAR
jgi:hypothetical protein